VTSSTGGSSLLEPCGDGSGRSQKVQIIDLTSPSSILMRIDTHYKTGEDIILTHTERSGRALRFSIFPDDQRLECVGVERSFGCQYDLFRKSLISGQSFPYFYSITQPHLPIMSQSQPASATSHHPPSRHPYPNWHYSSYAPSPPVAPSPPPSPPASPSPAPPAPS
jgi:hypothetical protein